MNRFARIVGFLAIGTSLALCPCCSTRANAEAAPTRSTGSAASVTLSVEGMICASCAFTVRTALKKLDGVKDARVSKAENRAVVHFDSARVTPQQMIEAVDKAGYRARVGVPPGSGGTETRRNQ